MIINATLNGQSVSIVDILIDQVSGFVDVVYVTSGGYLKIHRTNATTLATSSVITSVTADIIDGINDGDVPTWSIANERYEPDDTLSAKLAAIGQNYLKNTTPAVTDDTSEGYNVWDKWYDQTGGEVYICLDNTEGAAVWEMVSLDVSDLASLFNSKVDVEVGKSLVPDTEISKIHSQNTDTGTSNSTFQVGTGGPKIKNDAGTIKFRNAADDADAPVTGSSGTFSGAVSAANLSTNRSDPAAMEFYDSTCTDSDINAIIYTDPTDTGSGTEDVDLYFAQQIAGTLTVFLHIDADGNIDFQDRNITTTGAVSAGDTTVNDTITITDGTDSHVIKAVQETGLGGRLTIGLDETARTIVICDAGDVDTDFAMSVSCDPLLRVYSADLNSYFQYAKTGVMSTYNNGYTVLANAGLRLQGGYVDAVSGDWVLVNSNAGVELTDTDGEQSWLYIEPKINQSATGAYNAVKINVTETATGDGSAGQGNNLIWAGVGGTRKFEVDNTGVGYFAGALTAASYADNTPAYDGDAVTELAGIKTVDGELDHATLPLFARLDRVHKVTSKDPDVECDAAEAMEEYDAEVPDYDLIPTTDAKTGAEKTVKKMRVLEYKTKTFKLQDDGTIFEEKEPVYQTKTIRKKRVKEGYRFDESDGKFYKLGKTTSTEETIPGRDLGALISMLTVAVQQLDARLKNLEPIVAKK